MLFVSTYPGVLLKKGSKGKSVEKLQQQLNDRGYPCDKDGDFGDKTLECVIKFQSENGLQPDGQVGPLTWEKLFEEIPPDEPSEKTIEVLKTIKNRTDIYHQPTPQDLEGRGIWSKDQPGGRSERIYPAFILGPRRQVDSLVRQLYRLLPTQDTAFIITDRLVQYPEEYLPYISGAKNVVLIGSFVGIGKEPGYPQWARERHDRELWQLEQSIRLAQAMNRTITSIVFAMGDSPNSAAASVRTQLQGKLDDLLDLDRYSLSHLKNPITWGADETVLMAFAQTLPDTKVLIRISNPDCKHHFDGLQESKEIVEKKLATVGLTKVNAGWDYDSTFAATTTDWDFEVAILTRRPGGSINDFQENDGVQAKFDDSFLKRYQDYSAQQRTKLAIIDGRLFNGAWDARSVLPHCDLLAFGSWGTMGNATGATLAIAKILFHAQNFIAQKQLYLEAVAHDVFANGYKEAQRSGWRNIVKDRLNFDPLPFHHKGYAEQATVEAVFELLNQHINKRMQEHFADTTCLEGGKFRFIPQLWRTFESEVHLVPPLLGDIALAGVFRKDLASKTFHPFIA
jgi:hypothetical protein